MLGPNTQKKLIKRESFKQIRSEILTNFHIILVLKDGLYH